MSAVETPLTMAVVFSSWRWDWSTLVIVGGLGVGYWSRNSVAHRRGAGVGRGPVVCFLGLGLTTWVLATMSVIGVYADTLFWVRALQVVMLLFMVPFGLALGRPITVLRDAGGPPVRRRVDAVLGSRAARILTYPATTSVTMLATPWLLYLTGWYPAVLAHEPVDVVTRIVLVLVGFGYFYSRLQTDPVPHRYSQMISLIITIAETIGDAVLGIVLWLGPLIAAGYYAGLGRTWGPDLRTDQSIGAGIIWILGDVLGVPFLLVLMRNFLQDDRRNGARIDAELDATEQRTPGRAAAAMETDAGAPAPAETAPPRVWWEDDPQLQERFRRR